MTWALWCVLAAACGGQADKDADGVVAADDCDDADAAVFPGASELCDGVDNDCDGLIDDEDDLLGDDVPVWFADADGDGSGGAEVGAFCAPPPNLVAEGGDCDDTERTVYPGADEICDLLDNDCDDQIDADDPDYEGVEPTTWYGDNDGDGYGSAASFLEACMAPEGYVGDDTDCDDSDEGADRNPGAPEICDGKDNNCDVETGLLVDDEDPLVDLSAEPDYYVDSDGDGYGDPATAFRQCGTPTASSATATTATTPVIRRCLAGPRSATVSTTTATASTTVTSRPGSHPYRVRLDVSAPTGPRLGPGQGFPSWPMWTSLRP